MLEKILGLEHLNIYEKMCMIVMTKGQDPSDVKSMAKAMGCDEIFVKHTLDMLMLKGYLKKVEEEEVEEEALILTGEEAKEAKAYGFKKFESEKYSQEGLVDACIDLIEEPLSYKQAKIILSLAKQDFEVVKKSYQLAKASQVTDTIAFMINDLQKPKNRPQVEKKEGMAPKKAPRGNLSQVNTSKIMKLKKYQQYQKY